MTCGRRCLALAGIALSLRRGIRRSNQDFISGTRQREVLATLLRAEAGGQIARSDRLPEARWQTERTWLAEGESTSPMLWVRRLPGVAGGLSIVGVADPPFELSPTRLAVRTGLPGCSRTISTSPSSSSVSSSRTMAEPAGREGLNDALDASSAACCLAAAKAARSTGRIECR